MKWLGRIGCLFSWLALVGLANAQTASLLPNGTQQYFDNNGKPLANGNVYYYVPNTTTPKTTWTTSNESGPVQPNPIPLGIAGRPSSPIYGDGSYRQVLKDQFNNTIWDFTTASTGGSGGVTAIPTSEGVMVGTMIYWTGMTIPSQYLYAAGQTVSRTTNSALFTAITFSTTILCQSAIASITVSTNISDKTPIGAPIEASCFAPGTTVIAKSNGQLTLSSPATVTVSTSATIFPWGNGDGSTTFTLPDMRGRVPFGRNNMNGTASSILTSSYYLNSGVGVNPNAIGAVAGGQSHSSIVAELPSTQSSTGSVVQVQTLGGRQIPSTLGAVISAQPGNGGTPINAAPGTTSGGSGDWGAISIMQTTGPVLSTTVGTTATPFSVIPPGTTSDWIIKAFPDDSPTGPGVSSIQGMTGVITCAGTGITCTAQTITVNLPTNSGVTSVGGMTGAIACGTNVTCSGGTISATSTAIYLVPSQFGAVCNGSTDDTTALQTMLNNAAGKTVLFPAATCKITAHLNVLSNTTIMGSGSEVSVLKQTAADYLFNFADASNTVLSDMQLQGSDAYTSWGTSRVGAISISNTASQNNLTFRRLKLNSMNANYWIVGSQVANTSNVTFDDIEITTVVADVPTDVTVTNNTNYAIALFSAGAGVRWENTNLNNIRVEGTYMCFGVTLFSDFYKYRITNGRFLNMGAINTGGHCTNGLGATNTYGINIYDSRDDGNPPTDGLISNNYILNPQAAGIYVVGDGASFLLSHNSNNLLITGNVITGQTHTDTLLPRGAISVSFSTDVVITDNDLKGNLIGINVTSQNAGNISVSGGNHCASGAGGSICLTMTAGSNGSSNVDNRFVNGNFFNAGTTGMILASATGARFNNLTIGGNEIVGGTTGLNLSSPFISGLMTLEGNVIRSASGALAFGTVTGNLMLAPGNTVNNTSGAFGITFSLLPTAANGSQIFVSDGAPTSSPCTGTSTGSMAMRQNGAWKCF